MPAVQLVAISIGVLGFFTLPLLPVSLENVAEYVEPSCFNHRLALIFIFCLNRLTYPTPEETGSAILLLAGQVRATAVPVPFSA